MPRPFPVALALCGLLLLCQPGLAQPRNAPPARLPTGLPVALPPLGTVQPRNANEIGSSNWLIGCETLDRDMADYEQYKAYLVPLGIRRLRLQAGWAKTEKTKGKYDWAWLDKIINDATSRGLQPWLETSYGNPVYPGGGGINLSAGLPTSPEALAAWDRWVEALVKRYKDKVKEWEVWNEPNFGDNTINPPALVADLNIRTAEIIKRLQPEARISGLSMGHIDLDYADAFFKILHEKGKMPLFDNMTYHDYVYNPDANHGRVAELRRVLDRYAPQVKLRQGENGAPSVGGFGRGALGDYPWSELTQAKWITRRMLGNLGHDIECSILGIIDMNYNLPGSPITKLNVKGIIQSDSTRRAVRPKMAYHAMQHVASVFDHSLQRIPQVKHTHNKNLPSPGQQTVLYTVSTDRSLSVYGYQHRQTGRQVFTLWMDEHIPGEDNMPKPLNFTFTNGNFDQPVLVDVISGKVYDLPADQWRKEGNTYSFTNVPVYDAPVLIADKSLIPM
ncbi:MAG: beta-galactosidase [Cytophagales bacterium]|nr:beta-galactosidase [Cytophagales bacterium]